MQDTLCTPETARLFTAWRHPVNGVESLVLTERPAPAQFSFYFTNRSFTDDGRYLWVACAFPPPGGGSACPVLGVVDFERDEMRVYHETQFSDASPLVDARSGEIYWIAGLDLWRRGPEADARPMRLNRFSPELAKGRRPHRISTHLTFSADRAYVNLDAELGTEWFVGEFPLDGSPARIWQTLDCCYNHGQFSPTDPDLQLIAQDGWTDPATGVHGDYTHRMWLLRRGQEAEPIYQEPTPMHGHEWWDPSGRQVWYVHYGVGVKRVNIETRQTVLVWPRHVSHAHANRSGQFLVADLEASGPQPRCHVVFYNVATGKEIEIVSHPALPDTAARAGHLHPHPQFCCNDRYVCYTTNVYGRIDLALVRTSELVARTR